MTELAIETAESSMSRMFRIARSVGDFCLRDTWNSLANTAMARQGLIDLAEYLRQEAETNDPALTEEEKI